MAETLRAPFAAFDDFLPAAEAVELRRHVDQHFQRPSEHRPDTHQIWNYWHVPGLYTYLRTSPEKVIPIALVRQFHAALSQWARERLGLDHVSWPNLSVYVDGCGQGLHNDATNGRFGYVYSLTRGDRQSRGGETIVFKEGDPFRTRLARADAGSGLYDLIDPVFNRLAIFDDRMPHGVQRIEGSMDPLDGRIVLHGHVSEGDASVCGPLSSEAVAAAVKTNLKAIFAAEGTSARNYHGPLVIRLQIAATGEVEGHCVLVDRVARSDDGSSDGFVTAIVEGVASTRFPIADAASEVTLPILVGGTLPRVQRR